MSSILAVVHQETSDPGLVGQILTSRGYRFQQCCPALGDELPDPSTYAGVIVFGGPMSANDDQTLPFIHQELRWMDRVLAADVPLLGICLGAQLLARALGATVEAHPEGLREIGYFPLYRAEDDRLFQQPMHVYHWHQEGFELPNGAQLLAQGDLFVNQAFRYGKRAFGLQFHPEITAELIELWTTRGAEQLLLPGAQAQSLQVYQHRLYSKAVETWLARFLDHWLPGQARSPWMLTA
ncbi:glutamine amidotransferase [filamentous cyanobacterium CCP5]|nr:glutamine amidotransferase [filamentous cyanobacterium CCP5]